MLLVIGNPTNIYLSSIFSLSFLEYFNTMLLPTLMVGGLSFIVLNVLFKKDLEKKIEVFEVEQNKIKNPRGA